MQKLSHHYDKISEYRDLNEKRMTGKAFIKEEEALSSDDSVLST